MKAINQPVMNKLIPLATALLACSVMGLQGCSTTTAVAEAPKPAPAPAWKQGMGADMFKTSWWAYIGTGAAFGTVMFLNVWLIIWPNQKIVIASAKQIAAGGTALPEAAGAAAKAGLASRHNTLFSLPMLFMMGAASHLPSQINPEYSGVRLAGVILAILGLLEFNAIKGKTDNLKITSIMGVTHMGIFLTAIIYVLIEVLTK